MLKLKIKMFFYYISAIFGIALIGLILVIVTILSPLSTAKCLVGIGKEAEKAIKRIEDAKKGC